MSVEGPKPDDPIPAPDFRWQAFFQRCPQPLFLLDRHRRILFVNRAWEALAGKSAAAVRGLTCTRRAWTEAGSWDPVRRALTPPADVLDGRPAHARRLVGGSTWDIDFLPLREDDGVLGILGRIHSVVAEQPDDPALSDGLAALHEQARKLKAKHSDPDELWQPDVLLALRQRAAERYRLDLLGGELPALRQIAEQVRLVSRSPAAVLIVGEPGTGKRWLARTIHHHSEAERPFAVAECAHLPPDALAALLFGDGLARRPDFGTLYLAEPASLPRDLQGRLCDWLSSNARGWRLLAGARADLVEEVRAGRMLEELCCALSTVVIRLPPLRERRPDLARLAEGMLGRMAKAKENAATDLTPEAWELLRSHSWPGNLRELDAVLEFAAARATGKQIEAADLPAYLRLAVRPEAAPITVAEGLLPLDRLLEEAERRLILLALERTHGHRAKAADLLAIQRPRLFRRLKALGLAELTDAGGEEEPPIQVEE